MHLFQFKFFQKSSENFKWCKTGPIQYSSKVVHFLSFSFTSSYSNQSFEWQRESIQMDYLVGIWRWWWIKYFYRRWCGRSTSCRSPHWRGSWAERTCRINCQSWGLNCMLRNGWFGRLPRSSTFISFPPNIESSTIIWSPLDSTFTLHISSMIRSGRRALNKMSFDLEVILISVIVPYDYDLVDFACWLLKML